MELNQISKLSSTETAMTHFSWVCHSSENVKLRTINQDGLLRCDHYVSKRSVTVTCPDLLRLRTLM
jgi:hypothetical protein